MGARSHRKRHVDKYSGPASEPHKHRGHFKDDGTVKRSYSKARAEKVAAKVCADPRRPDQVAYACDLCPSWHIGRA